MQHAEGAVKHSPAPARQHGSGLHGAWRGCSLWSLHGHSTPHFLPRGGHLVGHLWPQPAPLSAKLFLPALLQVPNTSHLHSSIDPVLAVLTVRGLSKSASKTAHNKLGNLSLHGHPTHTFSKPGSKAVLSKPPSCMTPSYLTHLIPPQYCSAPLTLPGLIPSQVTSAQDTHPAHHRMLPQWCKAAPPSPLPLLRAAPA